MIVVIAFSTAACRSVEPFNDVIRVSLCFQSSFSIPGAFSTSQKDYFENFLFLKGRLTTHS